MLRKGLLITLLSMLMLVTHALPGVNQDDLVMHFENLTVREKLPSQRVLCVHQDLRGIMWFGTEEGLCKYDGYQFKEYVADIQDPASISNNAVRAICEDPNGNLWVGTDGGGLNLFIPESDRFYRIDIASGFPEITDEIKIYSLLMDDDGWLWIGSYGSGLFQLKTYPDVRGMIKRIVDNNLEIHRYHHIPGATNWLNDDHVFTLYLDRNSALWIGTDDYGTLEGGALHRAVFDPTTRKIKSFNTYRSDPNDNKTLGSNYIMSMYEDHQGNFWVCNWKGGLNLFDRLTGEVQRFQHDPSNPRSLNNDDVYTIMEDASGHIWVGTYGGGISRMHINSDGAPDFSAYTHHKTVQNTLVGNYVRQIYLDRNGLLWILTWKSGISKLRISKNPFRQIPAPKQSLSDTLTDAITAMTETPWGDVLLATQDHGICRYASEKRQIIPLDIDYGELKFSEDNPIQSLWYDRSSRLFIRHDNRWYPAEQGADKYAMVVGQDLEFAGPLREYAQIAAFKNDTMVTRLTHTYRCYFEDSRGDLWIGDRQSLYRISANHPPSAAVEVFTRSSIDPTALKGYQVTSIVEDTQGRIWVSTMDALNLYDSSSGRFRYFTMKDGLPGNAISGMMVDQRGLIWMSTDQGLVRFDPDLLRFKTFSESEGATLVHFGERTGYGMEDFQVFTACLTASDGSFLFGAIKGGMLVFSPDSVFFNSRPPTVSITALTILNSQVNVDDLINGRKILEKDISFTDEITLGWRDRSFSLSFAAMDFFEPFQNIYRFRLDPIDDGWHLSEPGERLARYANLKPGYYQFQVTGTNNDGIWSSLGASLNIRILPPWWKSSWFIVVLILLFSGLAVASRILTLQRHRIMQELRLERFKREELDKFSQMRINFFTNVTHEFRTPLTLILGPVQKLLEQKSIESSAHELLSLINRNARRLLSLVNQLIDFRKLEKQAVMLQVEEFDLVQYLRGIWELFNENAHSRSIRYSFLTEHDTLSVWLDKGAVEKMVFNLLSNAFKFTGKAGSISLSIRHLKLSSGEPQNKSTQNEHVEIRVEDSGVGIAEDQLNRIFDRFYQVDQQEAGSGIGLALVKELADLHKGSVSVTSSPGKGSVFLIQLPTSIGSYSPEELRNPSSGLTEHTIADGIIPELPEFQVSSVADKHLIKKDFRILLVEDHLEMRRFIRNGFPAEFLLNEVSGGYEALDWLKKNEADLILSDVMMPGLNGFELVRRIKEDILTSHIPVFLLTALHDSENQYHGFESGADDYIIKPFDIQLLVLKIVNHLKTRDEFIKHFHTAPELSIADIPFGKQDHDLINRIVQIINGSVADPDFGVRQLVDSIGMSHSVLFRKVKATTGLNMSELIVITRLRKAYEILKNSSAPVKEVAYQVGFSDPKYFSTVFKKHFGVAPSQVTVQKNSDQGPLE